MEIAGLVLLGIGTAYGAIYGGIKLYWAWQDRREAEPGSKLISNRAAVTKAWVTRERADEHFARLGPTRGVERRWVSWSAIAMVGAGLILLLLSRL